MDDADNAQDHIEREQPALLQQRQPPGPIPNGLCHWCGELVSDEARWCDAGCRELWEQARRAFVRNGRRVL